MSAAARALAPDNAAQCVADTVERAASVRAGSGNGADPVSEKEVGKK
jgi:hypothetical protein